MSVQDKLAAAGSWLDAAESYSEKQVEERFGASGQTGTVLTVVTLGITLLIGVLIYSQIQQSLPTPGNSQLQNASNNVTDGFADAMNLAPVIMIVLLAAVVLAVVQRFR